MSRIIPDLRDASGERQASNPAWASAFAKWVFEQDLDKHDDDEDHFDLEHRLEQGNEDHKEIDFNRLKQALANDVPNIDQSYRFLFGESGKSNDKTFLASKLTYNKHAMRCRPDLVLKHKYKNRYLIIDRKTTRKTRSLDINLNRWWNWRCQLWVYGYIDEWAEQNDIYLIGDIWHRYKSALVPTGKPVIFRKDNNDFDLSCRRWFIKYGGEISK